MVPTTLRTLLQLRTEPPPLYLEGFSPTVEDENSDIWTPTDPFEQTLTELADAPTPEVSFYIHDHLGNTRALYHTTYKSCNLQELYYHLEHVADYYPYGKTLREYIAEDAEKFLTTHHERDQETGLDYRGARFYDGEVGRFLGVDPLAIEYLSWSTYCYALGNTVKNIDISGLKVVPVIMSQSQVDAFNTILSNYFGNSKVFISYSGIPGDEISFNGPSNIGEFSEDQAKVFEEMSSIFNDSDNSISVSFTNTYPELGADDYHGAMINTEAMLLFDQVDGAGQGRTGLSLLVHGLTEQWSKQVLQGKSPVTEMNLDGTGDVTFDKAHIYALVKEALVTGLVPVGGGTMQNGSSTLSTVHYFNTEGKYQFSVLEGYNGSLRKLIRKYLNIDMGSLTQKNKEYVQEAINNINADN